MAEGNTQLGQPCLHLECCDSTNIVVAKMGEEGAPEGATVVAREQTAGRGRQGAAWFSSRQNLQFSFLLRPQSDPRLLPQLPFLNILIAYAIAKVFYAHCGLFAVLKWPNDLLVRGRKISGVMSEMRSRGDRPQFIVVGCGINLNARSEEFPEELRSITTSVFIEKGVTIDPQMFLRDFFATLNPLYERFNGHV